MKRISLNDGWELEGPVEGNPLEGVVLPAQVHDVLLANKIIVNPNITGHNKDRWIGEGVWVYRKSFWIEEGESEYNIRFEGIDTFADILLNGDKIGRNESAYMPLYLKRVPVHEGMNELGVVVYPPREILERIELPEKYQDRLLEFCKARVFRSGFTDYSGPMPDLIRMGIYGNVILEQIEKAGIIEAPMDVQLNSRQDQGRITVQLAYVGQKNADNAAIRCRIYEPDGELVYTKVTDGMPETLTMCVDYPKLWYPRTHGTQELYRVKVDLFVEQVLQDSLEKVVGFRRVEQRGTFDFYINGRPVKIYGANLAHADTMTGAYPKVRNKLYELLDLAEMGHFNCLRIWGESEILDDDFYEECDRRGILLWQDFYLGWGMFSEEPDMLDMCRREAEQLVKRLKHHPSLLLWCGGNELFWSRDMVYPGEYCFGEPIVTEVYPDVCRRLDPGRYYHCSSPSGGRFSNDPLGGDTHGYTHLWYVPGREYPVFLSENCRVSTPPLRSMKKMMTQKELWPEGYRNICTKKNPLCWPETWCDHNTNDGDIKVGPIEHYYDAENVQELIYRLGAAHSEYIKKQIEGFRRGRPIWDAIGPRRTKGHMLWKLNNNSNIISYGVVDYFNEPSMAYYALKRAYEPFQISFSIEDTIGVWAVNDTAKMMEGTVEVSLIEMLTGRVLHRKKFEFACEPDEAILLGSLDSFGQFSKNTVLAAEALDRTGTILAENTDYTEIERALNFPRKGNLKAEIQGDELVLYTDTFARSVELTGEEDGDEFGWLFEDNYFDLIPGKEKRVRVRGRHSKGIIHIQPYYWETGVEVVLSEEG